MSFYSPTYFVEYQFPAILGQLPGVARAAAVGRRKLPGSYELMRIASKKMMDGGMYVQCKECGFYVLLGTNSTTLCCLSGYQTNQL